MQALDLQLLTEQFSFRKDGEDQPEEQSACNEHWWKGDATQLAKSTGGDSLTPGGL